MQSECYVYIKTILIDWKSVIRTSVRRVCWAMFFAGPRGGEANQEAM